MKHLLHNAYDIHFHTAPDVVPRKCTDLELAARWLAAGMKGGVIKSHFSDTTGRAFIVRKEFKTLDVHGGLVLNRHTGGINPAAAERMAQSGGSFLWMPTLDARAFLQFKEGKPLPPNSEFVEVLDENNHLLPEVHEVLEVVRQFDLILCTGHLSAQEGIAVLSEAAKKGIRRMIVTHADNPANRYSIQWQKKCVALGAVIEHSYFTTYYDRSSWSRIAEEIKAVGPDHVCLSTDFGQMDSLHSDEGMEEYVKGLLKQGILERDLEKMISVNPKAILEKK